MGVHSLQNNKEKRADLIVIMYIKLIVFVFLGIINLYVSCMIGLQQADFSSFYTDLNSLMALLWPSFDDHNILLFDVVDVSDSSARDDSGRGPLLDTNLLFEPEKPKAGANKLRLEDVRRYNLRRGESYAEYRMRIKAYEATELAKKKLIPKEPLWLTKEKEEWIKIEKALKAHEKKLKEWETF